MTARLLLLGLTAILIPVSFVQAPYPTELILQHVPTVVGVALLTWAALRFRPSTASFACCLVFLWLHIVGARWIYSFVPYDDWMQVLTGHTVSHTFSWERNHYDRMVHFASGLLGAPPISEFLQSTCRLHSASAALVAMMFVLAIGAIYEILEWQIAMTFSPRMAESYNGQQGDVWDAQKDLALAWLGSIACLPLIFRWTPGSRERLQFD